MSLKERLTVEARFVGGPAEGEIRAIEGLVPEINVAHLPPMRYGWWDAGPEIREVAVETHVYRPTRVVAYYGHEGQR